MLVPFANVCVVSTARNYKCMYIVNVPARINRSSARYVTEMIRSTCIGQYSIFNFHTLAV